MYLSFIFIVSSVSATCFYHLRQLRRIRRSLDADSAATLVHAFVPSRVDYCNSILAAAPKSEDNNRQATTSVKRCCTSRQRHREVWPGTVTTDAPATRSYTGWTFPSELTTSWGADPPVSARQGASVVYLSNCCIPVNQVATRRHLRSAARHQLTVPRHRLSTYDRRAFAVAGPTMFNTLPDDLRDHEVCTSTFGQSLKTRLFSAISTFSALGVSHVMRSINVRYLLYFYLLNRTC